MSFQAENAAAGGNRSDARNRTACAIPLGVLTQAIKILLVIGVSRTSALAQPADTPPQNASGVEALKSLRAELEEAGRVWITKHRAASSDEERMELKMHSPLRAFEPRFLEFAHAHATERVAMEAVQWLADTAHPGPVFDEGLALVERHHIEDERIIKLCRTLVFRRSPGIDRFLLAVATKHPDHNVQGIARLCLARYLKSFHKFAVETREADEDWWDQLGYSDEVIAWIRATDSGQLADRTAAICDQIINQYPDVIDDEYANATSERRSLADAAKAVLFSLHAVGSAAPEVVGKNVDGNRVSLGEQRGKVVLLMFSANWCGPCKVLYGQLRKLLELHESKPFTVITVMADDESSTVAKAVEAGEITWPAIWDGRHGPIASAWDINSYPTLYLIDRDGRIQSKGLRDDALYDEVANMLGIPPEARVKFDKRTTAWDLSLRDRNISDEELPKLLEGYTELRSLDLSYNPITDEAMIHLKSLTKLMSLSLDHTKVTDEGLLNLKNLRSLRELTVQHRTDTNEGTTSVGRRKLANEITGLTILFVTH